jgi:hypothetical protein
MGRNGMQSKQWTVSGVRRGRSLAVAARDLAAMHVTQETPLTEVTHLQPEPAPAPEPEPEPEPAPTPVPPVSGGFMTGLFGGGNLQ